ncbi:MAG: YfhO family protein [Lachnospiraceae bacterium]|nr:YfhO family protein [Lachnospiraceae bacterium]
MKTDLKKRILIYCLAFIIPVVMVVIFFALSHIYPFGDESLLVWDMNRQFISYYSYLKTVLEGGNDLFYTFSKTLGGDMPGFCAYYLHDPLLALLLLFPGGSIAVGIEVIFMLQLGFAGLSCSVLLNKRYGYDPASLIFSTAYPFCSFFFAYISNLAFFTVLMILPVILYLFLEVIEKRRCRIPFTLMLFLAVWMNYYQGYMVIIFLGIIFISRVIIDFDNLKAIKDVVLCVTEAVLLDAFSLIPTVIALRGQKSTTEADFSFYRKFSLFRFTSAFYSGALRNDMLPQVYCSIIVAVSVLAYFFLKEINIREKAGNAFVIISLAASMFINTVDAVWHGFNNPVGVPWRYSYLLSLSFVILGYRAYLKMKKEIPVFIAGALFAALCVIHALVNNPYIDRERLIINASVTVVITALLAIFPSFRKKHGKLILGVLFLISFSDMLYNSRVVFANLNDRLTEDEKTNISGFERSYDEISEVIDGVKKDPGFFRTEKTFEYSMNDPMLFDQPGLSHSSSCERIDVRHFMQRMGFRDTGLYAFYAGGSTAFADSFLGVKYLISQWDGLEKGYSYEGGTDKYYIFRNENVMPLAYLTDPALRDVDAAEGNTFELQNNIAGSVFDKEIFKKARSETVKPENAVPAGDNIYRKTGEGDAFLIYDIDITEEYPLYMYFDAPFTGYSEIFVNDVSWDQYFTETHWNVVCAGTFKKGDRVRIKLKIIEEELEVDEACFYYEDMDALSQWHDILEEKNRDNSEITRLSSSHLKFDVDAGDGDILLVTVPYTKGWHITVDGQRVESEKILDILTGVGLTEGKHEIDMRFIPPGLNIGILASLLGIILMIITNIKRSSSVQ